MNDTQQYYLLVIILAALLGYIIYDIVLTIRVKGWGWALLVVLALIVGFGIVYYAKGYQRLEANDDTETYNNDLQGCPRAHHSGPENKRAYIGARTSVDDREPQLTLDASGQRSIVECGSPSWTSKP
jgi:hypothetical protein